jgi:hypothetical protein
MPTATGNKPSGRWLLRCVFRRPHEPGRAGALFDVRLRSNEKQEAGLIELEEISVDPRKFSDRIYIGRRLFVVIVGYVGRAGTVLDPSRPSTAPTI